MELTDLYIYFMNLNNMRMLAFAGILLALFLSVWYLVKTYNEGNPRWIYLILTFGIAVLLSQNLRSGGRRKD
ncbi:hypothetical protein [Ekhidna sp.]|uniref:hypothetical protein n=1 Tax=Ekhidna sp. TaxID=2608089 RepID=UPI003B5AA019